MSVLAFFALFVPCFQAAVNAVEPIAARAWFTDALIDGSWQGSRPADALPDAPDTVGNGVSLERSAPVENPLLEQKNGLVSFWINPNWNGNDGERHILLRIGDPHGNGLLVEKAESVMLRYVMASPVKTTAARWDVSDWKAKEWHHVAVSWITVNNRPVVLNPGLSQC